MNKRGDIMGMPNHPEYNPSSTYNWTDHVADTITSPSKLANSRVLDWNRDGVVDNLEAVGSGLGVVAGTILAKKGIEALKDRHDRKMMERYGVQQFSEDGEKKGNRIDEFKKKVKPSKEDAPIYAVGAALGAGAYQLAKKAVNSETGQKIKNALFSEEEKEHPIVRGASTGAKVGGLGIASTLAGHAVGRHNQMVEDTVSKIEDIFLANPTYSITQNSDNTVTARFIPAGSILPKSADGSSATDATMNLYKKAFGKEMVDTNPLDVTGDGSLKDELGIGAAVLLGSSLLGSAIAQYKDKKKKKKGFSERDNKVPGWVTAAGLGAGTTALGGAYILDKTGASEKVWNAAKNAYEYITNPEIYEKIKGVVDISGDGSMIDELGSAGVTLGLGTLLARQLYKKNKKRDFDELEHITVKNNIFPGAMRSSLIDSMSKGITGVGKIGLTAGGAYGTYKYLDSKDYIPEALKEDVANTWNRFTGGDIKDLEGLVNKPKGGIISDVKALRDAVTQHGARIDSPLTTMIAEEKGLDPDTFHSNIEEYGLGLGALAAGIALKKAWNKHQVNKQKELNRNKDIAVAGIKQNQLNAERLLNKRSQKRAATESVREKRGL